MPTKPLSHLDFFCVFIKAGEIITAINWSIWLTEKEGN